MKRPQWGALIPFLPIFYVLAIMAVLTGYMHSRSECNLQNGVLVRGTFWWACVAKP